MAYCNFTKIGYTLCIYIFQRCHLKKNNLTVLRGGLLDSAATSRKTFVSAYITNTRLMGVVGMYMHFRLPDNQTLGELHQFFYFDSEEFGFENYQSVLGRNPMRLSEIENSLIGGLGGEKVQVTLREACYLLQEYVRFNKKHQIPLPEGLTEYGFLLEQEVFLSEPEHYILINKQCTSVENSYEAINYFLMRVIGKDFEAAGYLACKDLNMNLFPEHPAGAFCKNTIEREDDADTYLCESLLEFSGNYYISVTEVALTGLMVSRFERISLFRVSPAEAAMTLARSEFISVYEMLIDPSTFPPASTEKSAAAMVTFHDNGVLYMIFHPNNKHVAKREYRLNEDVLGMYFITTSGQLLAAAYSLEEIKLLEKDLSESSIGHSLIPIGRYEFQEAVLYEFIQSGFGSFEDFVNAIRTDDED